MISADLIRPLPESKGYNMILVVVDKFSKKAFFILTNMTMLSQGLATLFRDNIFREHGIPRKVISN
jgi:hypothetical protein